MVQRFTPPVQGVADDGRRDIAQRTVTRQLGGDLERAAAADPRQAEIGEHLGDAYWAAGRRVDARYAWSAALLHADATEGSRLRAKLDMGLTIASAAP